MASYMDEAPAKGNSRGSMDLKGQRIAYGHSDTTLKRASKNAEARAEKIAEAEAKWGLTEITRQRLAAEERDWHTIPNDGKADPCWGWNTMDTSFLAILEQNRWGKHNLGWSLRLDRGDGAIDNDVIRQDMVDKIAAIGSDVFGFDYPQICRFGSRGELWIVNCPDADCVRVASRTWLDPDHDAKTDPKTGLRIPQRVEIYFGNNVRQIGMGGAHSINPDRSIKLSYTLDGGFGPHNIHRDDVDKVTMAQICRFLDAVDALFLAKGWEQVLRARAGRTGGEDVFDMDDNPPILLREYGPQDWEWLQEHWGEVTKLDERCSAMSFEGPECTNDERCVLHKRGDLFFIHDFDDGDRHFRKCDDPTVRFPTAMERLRRLAAKMGA